MILKSKYLTLLVLCSIGLVAHAQAQPEAMKTTSDLVREAMELGKPVRSLLGGVSAQYLRESLKTDKPIFATATVLKRVDDKCVRARLDFSIPDLIVTAKNPQNPKDVRTGPFVSTVEANFCDKG